jgi:TRAP-type C4-dicarboxylate transport system permease small subunit
MLRWLDRAVEALLGLIALALAGTAFSQVVARYAFASAFTWVLELDVLLLVWLTLLSGYVGVRRGAHMASDFALGRLSPAARRRIAIVSQLLCAAFVALAGWKSLEIVDAMQGMAFASIPVGQPAMYWSLPVGMGLMLLAIAAEIVRLARGGSRNERR